MGKDRENRKMCWETLGLRKNNTEEYLGTTDKKPWILLGFKAISIDLRGKFAFFFRLQSCLFFM